MKYIIMAIALTIMQGAQAAGVILKTLDPTRGAIQFEVTYVRNDVAGLGSSSFNQYGVEPVELPPVTVTGKRDRATVCASDFGCLDVINSMRQQSTGLIQQYLLERAPQLREVDAKAIAEFIKRDACTVLPSLSPDDKNATWQTDANIRAIAASHIIDKTMLVRTWNGTVWAWIKGFTTGGDKLQTFAVVFTDGTTEDYQWHAMASAGVITAVEGSLKNGSGVPLSNCPK